jgi:hypothetical protein
VQTWLHHLAMIHDEHDPSSCVWTQCRRSSIEPSLQSQHRSVHNRLALVIMSVDTLLKSKHKLAGLLSNAAIESCTHALETGLQTSRAGQPSSRGETSAPSGKRKQPRSGCREAKGELCQ